jgi:hypothetical protein
MWSRVDGWESIVPGPFAAVFVEDYGYDPTMLVRALEAEAQDEDMYTQVCARCGLPVNLTIWLPIFTPFLSAVDAAASLVEIRGATHVNESCLMAVLWSSLAFDPGIGPPLAVGADVGRRWFEEPQKKREVVRA